MASKEVGVIKKTFSLTTERIFQRQKLERRAELLKAVSYCRTNGCRGWKAIKNLDLQYVKSPITINNALDDKVCQEHRRNDQRSQSQSQVGFYYGV